MKRFVIWTIAAAFLQVPLFAAGLVKQNVDTTDAMATLGNYDRGFYTPQVLHLKPSGGKPIEKPSGRLLHLRAEISEFSSHAWLGIDSASGDTTWGKNQDLTEDFAQLGTASYMSPEQIRDSKNITPASDVFSIGIVACEMLLGENPFRGESLAETFNNIQKKKISAKAFSPRSSISMARIKDSWATSKFWTGAAFGLSEVAGSLARAAESAAVIWAPPASLRGAELQAAKITASAKLKMNQRPPRNITSLQ